ncbi:GlxA family transcriptional regulator [Sinorhizobium meliloti]|uniref:GlxA family transcriptional regulator n=1 Tax=Rhizobium meliloti TaxID=382 RepID=UPI0012980C8F|nr:GlxA family transcriptional regulator [Sinorhizobium meliloti]MQU68387.1 helix-turn-helix domain-containing protein [Sinorhizobium meliloti]
MKPVGAEPRLFAFYLVPDFTMTAVSSAIEALRMTNDILGYDAYAWRLVTATGENVKASCGLTLTVDSSVAAERKHLATRHGQPYMALVCGGKHIHRHADRSVEVWLRECRNRSIAIGSLCTGAHILARAGLLDDRKCSIHWESIAGFTEHFHAPIVGSSVYEIDGNIFTCAGGVASFDMMLQIIQCDFGENVVSSICELALIDRVRGPTERQRLPLAQRVGVRDRTILMLVEQMEQTLVEPVKIDALTSKVGLSRRQVERIFRNELRCSPARYYLKLRLERAQHLLIQTSIPIVEVATACGFVSSSHFSKCYRQEYGCSPQETRARATHVLHPSGYLSIAASAA